MNFAQADKKSKFNTEKENLTTEDIFFIVSNYSPEIMSGFYEMQSNFMRARYKKHEGLEISTIIICLVKSFHLTIMRLRERNLNHNISIDNFYANYLATNNYNEVSLKIVDIVNETGIPKETVRRKLIKLSKKNIVKTNESKEYTWNLEKKREKDYINILQEDIKSISKFLLTISKFANIHLEKSSVEKIIKNNFSFFTYHFYSSQLKWLKWWQTKFNDIDLMLVLIQILIPTIKYFEKGINSTDINISNLHTIIGKTNFKYKSSPSASAVSATSISDITGIPRATSIRKLEKLVKLGVLVKENKTKRYYINESLSGRTKNVFTKETVDFTLSTFGDFIAIVINAIRNY